MTFRCIGCKTMIDLSKRVMTMNKTNSYCDITMIYRLRRALYLILCIDTGKLFIYIYIYYCNKSTYQLENVQRG